MASSALSAKDVGGLLSDAARAVERARSAGADDVVASVSAGRSTEFSWRDGKLETVAESASRSLSVQLFVDGRYSVHSTNDLRDETLASFLEDAVELTRALAPDPHRKPVDPALQAGRSEVDLELADAELIESDRERSLAWLAEMDAIAREDERVLSATSRLDSGFGASAMVSSGGFEGTRESTLVWMGTDVTVQDEGDKRPEASFYRGARHLADAPEPGSIAREARRRAIERLGSTKGPTTRATLVVDREAAGRLFGPMLGALSASSIQQKRSFLAEQRGEPIASSLLTVRDEPLLPRGLGSRTYDGEGIAAHERTILEAGVLNEYFVDTYYGSKLGWTPTSGSPSNLVLALGDRGRDALVADAGDGVYVTSWLGGNCDPTTGDFSFGLRGLAIEGGRCAHPIGEMNATGNIRDLFSRLVAVGDDPHPFSSLRTPTLVFEGVELSGS